ncbi:MAG: peptidoglycan-binding protein [Treponema sp.]|uniref:peptidoglycan-binding domain-containing protein n=1 Tax=Treponema sp. TaxID=166 RepID=UPI00298E6B77|nr:peptidoglycan-binding domain-containing protein [Treponema sp.]MCQ2600626.1 peptidoglycan-binding protein [Treponema sp.]
MKKQASILILLLSVFSLYAQGAKRELKVTKPRMNGEDVVYVQTKLLEMGFTEVGEADGYYGPMSEGAVKELQKLIDVPVNGEVHDVLYDFLESKEMASVREAIKVYNQNKNENNCVSNEEYLKRTNGPFNQTIFVYKTGKKTAYCMYEEAYDFYGLSEKLVKVNDSVYFLAGSETTASNPDGGGLNPWDPDLKIVWETEYYSYILINNNFYRVAGSKLEKVKDSEILNMINYCKNKF